MQMKAFGRGETLSPGIFAALLFIQEVGFGQP